MPSLGPLIAFQSCYSRTSGMVPPGLLVEAASDAGYRIAAIVDEGTLKGAPSFLAACRERSILPLVGMLVRVSHPQSRGPSRPADVFDYGDSLMALAEPPTDEAVALLALNRKGYQNLLRLKEMNESSAHGSLSPEDLLNHSESLFLLLGPPGSEVARVVAGKAPAQSVGWLQDLAASWPKDRAANGALETGEAGTGLGRQAARLAKIPGSPPSVAVVWAAYRNERERFWGHARTLLHEGTNVRASGIFPGGLPRGETVARAFEGLSVAFRAVDRVLAKAEVVLPATPLSAPSYPTPRGTDVGSFFWTLGQEAAIATGHIRAQGGKERLMEEFQFLKQTVWPGIWLILWDLRRRLGLPPGTLRPSTAWIGTSLFAHLLGLSRIDPLRERIPFAPSTESLRQGAGMSVEVEAPEGWDQELVGALEAIFGRNHSGILDRPHRWNREALIPAGHELLARWEDLEFTGDRPRTVPPLPSYAERSDESLSANPPIDIVVSGTNLGQLFAAGVGGLPHLDTCREETSHLGGLILRMVSPPSQTLAAAPAYRGVTARKLKCAGGKETLTDWIERHEGLEYQERGYGEDAGPLEALAASSSLLRLFTLPGASGYRPLLRHWIEKAAPARIGELADLLALQWHWTYWTHRPARRLIACHRAHPLRHEEKAPPWWDDWEEFVEESRIDSRRAGLLSSALEKATQTTGGWLLFREQLDSALEEALQISAADRELWLSGDEAAGVSESSSAGEDSYWDRRVRSAFRAFLGNPNPLPSRLEFLGRAERLLMAADAFTADPAAVVAAAACLFPEETEERREVYAILRQKGFQLSLPRLAPGCRFDRSPSKEQILLGTLNVVGVGPQIAPELESFCLPSDYPISIRSLFLNDSSPPPGTWKEWLHATSSSLVGRTLLSKLIHLGLFDGYGMPRETLVSQAFAAWKHDTSSSGVIQETLFSIKEGDSRSRGSQRQTGKENHPIHGGTVGAEIESLRIAVTGTPFDPLRDSLPRKWMEDTQGDPQHPFLLPGWVHAIDFFSRSTEARTEEDGFGGWMTFLLFNHRSVYRVIDESGCLLPLLPVPVPEDVRLDGHRFHLKAPWLVLCDGHARPSGPRLDYPVFSVKAGENLADLGRGCDLWSEMRVVLNSASPDLSDGMEDLLDWFEMEQGGVTVAFETSAGFLRRGSVRRLVGRLGPRRVAPSRLLLERLRNLSGVESADLIPSQPRLFWEESQAQVEST